MMTNAKEALTQSMHELQLLETQIALLKDQINDLTGAPRDDSSVVTLMNSLTTNIQHAESLLKAYQNQQFVPFLGTVS